MNRSIVILTLAGLLVGATSWAQNDWFVPTDPFSSEVELDHNVKSEFVTPHTDWGSPWAQGRARVLFFVNGRGTAAREVVELAQRFDIDAQMVFWGRLIDTSRDDWHGGDEGLQRIDRLLGEKWDAFVFLGIKLENLSSERQFRLLEAVADGAGLVISGYDDARLLKDSNRMDPVPPCLATGPVGDAFKLREGRGVRLPAQPSIAYAPGWEVEYDYWAARLGRAVLWAAGKEPQIALTLEQREPEVQRAALPSVEATVRWKAPAACENLRFDIKLRRSDGWEVALPAVKAGQLEGSAEVEVPLVRAGAYHVDVIARSDRGVEDFGSVAFNVVSPRGVGVLELDQDWGEVGSYLRGKVSLSGEPGGADERLVVSLLDPRGRELMREVSSITDAGAGRFRFRIEPWLPMLVTVRATLIEGAEEVSSAWTFANITKRNRGQFNFLIWDLPRGALAPYAEESLARSGVTLQLGSGSPSPYVAANNIAWVPYTTHIYAKRGEGGVMDPFCWNDEAQFQAYVDEIADKHVATSHHGVFAYSLGDEIAVRGSCLSPHCLAAYRRYLQQEYGSIAALNSSWGTQYTGFEQVELSKPDDDMESTAFDAGNYPRWYDRQAYQSYNFCKLCERFGESFRRIDPQAVCGFEGAGSFKGGDDLDGFVRSNTFWSPYPGTADEVVRSIAPREFPRSNWMGYTKDADTLLLQYWRMLTRGCDAVWWWRWEVIGRFHGWLSPTLDPYPAVQEILRDTQTVREGLGDLLLQSEMLDDGIGMLFSQPSAYATRVQQSPSYGGYEGEHMAWHSAIRELGMNFRYFTDRQLRLKEAGLERFKVIILASTQAIGPVEADLLREYVRGGGVLIADVRPGIYDGHVKPLQSGVLDDVFGVKRVGFDAAVTADAQVKGTLGEVDVELALEGARVDAGIQAAGAQSLGAAGETPIVLVNSFGQGKAVLLNMSMSSYPGLASETTPEAAAEAVEALFALAGVRPAVVLRNGDGQRLRNVEVTRWRNGDMELVSVFRQKGLAESAQLELRGAQRLFDIKDGRDLGHQRSYQVQITPYRARFYAASAEPIASVSVATEKASVAPGEVAQVQVAFPKANGTRAGYLRVKQPDGQPAEWLDQVVVAGAEPVTVSLPVAFNDPEGTWTVSIDELCSDRGGACRFNVKQVK